jgi:cellulose synthase operon protein YhjQ
MKIITMTSACGGVGKTTVLAALAVLLRRRRIPVVAVELCAANVLGAFLGVAAEPLAGISSCVEQGKAISWPPLLQKSAIDVDMVPFGRGETSDILALDALFCSDADWLARRLLDFTGLEDGVILLDSSAIPEIKAMQAVRCADLVLCVTQPHPAGSALLARNFSALAANCRQVKVVANGIVPARVQHYDILTMLRASLGADALLPFFVHQDSAIPDSFALGQPCFDVFPHSQAAHDMQGLGNWVARWLEAQAPAQNSKSVVR